ncbi:hypothetical protein HDU99_005278, partial [Rhizoclosmatium hyalinum]
SWVAFTEGLFPVSEINLMERQFLGILDFDLSFTDDDYLTVMDQLAAYEARIASLVACSAVPPIHSQTHNLHYQHHPQATPPSLASSYSSVMSYEQQQPQHYSQPPADYYARKQQFHQSFSQGYMPSPANTASPVSLSGSLGSSYSSNSSTPSRFHPHMATAAPMNSQLGFPVNSQLGKRPISSNDPTTLV